MCGSWALEHSPSWEAHRFSASQEIPRILWNPTFTTAFTSARHLFLSWARSFQSMSPHPTSWRSVLILYSNLINLGLPSGLFLSGFLTKTLYTPSLSPIRATCPSYLILLDLITQTTLGEEYRSLSSSLCSFLHSLITSSLLDPNIFLSTLFSNALAYIPPSLWATKFHTPDKWVTVTMAWHVSELWMEEWPTVWKVAANILNKQSQTDNKGWSSSWGVGQGADNSSP